ncbi:polyprenyl synthetase family protein [Rubritalea marina]|uniref:polyprenyl synthetase family protein n=1 Tax=Rubritalea marina TaxID=361055 RepID=UPI000370235B|nr:farnesyl diphosphate synthase [Rubritalea marina]
MSDLKEWLKAQQDKVDTKLDALLPSASTSPSTIHEAMRYSVFAGGKRLRPILCLAASQACGGEQEAALYPACAVEVMHTYSLVHDDLPCMDDDDLRRGRPTSHVVYGEGVAVLTGDALLTEAFTMVAHTPSCERYSAADYVLEFSETGGSKKLIGGQILDLEGEGQNLNQEQLVQIHEAKTAALLCSSLRLGGMSANCTSEQLQALTSFGYNLGLAFQVIDDILDVTQTTEQLGKTAGKDESVEKSTYPAILGLEESKLEATRLTTLALEALQPLGDRAMRLEQIARHMLVREF